MSRSGPEHPRSSRRLLTRYSVALATCVFAAALSHESFAAKDPYHELFAGGVKALQKGQFEQAIDHFELLADRGLVHPDASFDRALSYIERARSAAARPGDLGRASAALHEVLELRPSDEEAKRGLSVVLQEISRRKRRGNDAPVIVRPTLLRAVTGLLSTDAWALGAAFGSLILTVGLILRMLGKVSSVKLAGAICIGIGLSLALSLSALGLTAYHFQTTSRPAVVVVPEARLLDERGVPIVQKDGVPEYTSIIEGAYVYQLERRGTLAKVQWGNDIGWVAMNQLRLLAQP